LKRNGMAQHRNQKKGKGSRNIEKNKKKLQIEEEKRLTVREW